MIDGNRLVDFLGHSSVFPGLDRYLTEGNLSKRPKGQDLTQYIAFDSLGLVLIFRASVTYREEVGDPLDDGRWIFTGMHFYNKDQNEKNEKFSGVLPYELSFEFNRSDVCGKLGPPKLNRERDGYATCTFPLSHGIVVTASVATENGEARWFKVEKIEKSHRARGAV